MSDNKPWEESLALGDTKGRVREHKEPDGTVWYDGTVLTPWGIVDVYSDTAYTRYDVVFSHRLYSRYERRGRKARGIAKEAALFAKRIFSHV
jgi:hypothetical protein